MPGTWGSRVGKSDFSLPKPTFRGVLSFEQDSDQPIEEICASCAKGGATLRCSSPIPYCKQRDSEFSESLKISIDFC